MERLALRGSTARRQARYTADEQAAGEALLRARDAYEQAAERHRDLTGKSDSYSVINFRLLDWICALRVPQDTPFDREAALAALDEYREKGDSTPSADFWTRVAVPDAALTRALIEDRLAPDADRIRELYAKVFAPSSGRQRSTVVEHLAVIASLLPAGSSDVSRGLLELREQLSRWSGSP